MDEELAARVNGFGMPTIQRLVALAAALFAPEEQAAKEQQSRSQRYVTLTHPRPGAFAGTSYLEAAGDTQDLTGFYALVCEEAKRLGRLGDTDDYETRKAKALGIIAAPPAPPSTSTRPGRQVHAVANRHPDATPSPARPAADGCATEAKGLIDARPGTCVSRDVVRDATHGSPTSTTSSRTSHPTRADHPARRTRRTSRRCVAAITGPRPRSDGATNAPRTAPTPGPHPTRSTTSSTAPAPSPTPPLSPARAAPRRAGALAEMTTIRR